MNKKLVIPLIVAAGLLLALIYWFVSNQNTQSAVEEPQAKSVVDDTISDKEILNELSIPETKKRVNPKDVSEIASCEDLKENYPEAMFYIERAVQDIFIPKTELNNTGGYSTMTSEELDALAESGDTTAIIKKGTRNFEQGYAGMSTEEVMHLYRNDKEEYQDWYDNYQMDFEKISKGEEYFYQASLRGKLGGLWENLMLKNILIRHMMMRKLPSEDVYGQIVEKKALLEIWRKVNVNNPEVLKMLDTDVMETAVDELQAKYSTQYDLTINEKDITEKTNDAVNKFIGRWEKDRAYLGEDAYLRFIPEAFSTQAEKALELSCWRQNS